MMNLTIIFSLILIMFFWGCSGQNCPEKINLKPMYGGLKKCRKQIESDYAFLHTCDTTFKSRKEACEHYIKRGWEYFYANILDTSMMRFNQAWLLDSSNYEIYWGFGNLLGKQNQFKQSLPYFERAIKLNPNQPIIWESASTSYGNIFFQTKDVKYLDSCIAYLKHSMELEPSARIYGQLTSAYSFFMQKDSAKKYLELTDKLDSTAVNPEVRRLLK